MTRYKISGAYHDLYVSFPWTEGYAIQIDLHKKSGERLDCFVQPIPPALFRRVEGYIPLAQIFISRIFSDRDGT